MKKALSLLLSILLVFSTISVVSFADEKNYDLRVGSVLVNSANKGNILGDGTVSYNEETHTLTLKDAVLSVCNVVKSSSKIKTYSDIVVSETDPLKTETSVKSYTSYGSSVGAFIYYSGTDDLHIVLIGNNRFESDENIASMTDFAPDGIAYYGSGNVIFEGNGEITVDGNFYDGVFSNGGIIVNGQKMNFNTKGSGLHAEEGDILVTGTSILSTKNCQYGIRDVHGSILIDGNPVIVCEDVSYGIHSKNSVSIVNGKITIKCSRYGIFGGVDADLNKGYGTVTIAGGDIYIEGSDEPFNPVFARKDVEISGGRLISDCQWGIWANRNINILGGLIELHAEEDGLLQTGYDECINISGGTLILKTDKGNAFSYMGDDETYPAQKPILDGYENVSIDYGSDFGHLVKGQNLENAERDEYWKSQVVIIRAKNDPQPKPRNTVVIEIGPMEQETETNPDTGAPIFGIGRTAVLAAEFLVSKR